MPTFNLFTVIKYAEDVESIVATAVKDFHEALQKIGLEVRSSTLTSDSGQKDVTPKPVEPPAEPEVPAEPEAPAETVPEEPVEATPDAATEETPPAE